MPKKQDELRQPTQAIGFQLRFQERIRARLEQAAKENGTSLNSEIVARLERSLADDELLGGATAKLLLVELAGQVARGEALTGKRWLEDAKTFGAVRELVLRWINERRPPARNASKIEAALTKALSSNTKVQGALVHLDQARVISQIQIGGAVDLLDGSSRGLKGARPPAATPKTRLGGLLASYLQEPQSPPSDADTQEKRERHDALNALLAPYGYRLAVETFDTDKWGLEIDAAEIPVVRGYLDLLPAWIETARHDRAEYLDAWAEDEAEVKAGIALAQPQEVPED